MKTSIKFSENLRLFIELLEKIVWESFQKGLEFDDEWPESEFFSALITQGFRGVDPRSKTHINELKHGSPYSLSFDVVRHNSNVMEPLTGADIAVLIKLRANKQTILQKVFLVQLKKAVLHKNTTTFNEIHHLSGEKKFGHPIHQGEKMLLFTPYSVFWLAVPPTVTDDEEFFKVYTELSSLSQYSKRRANSKNYQFVTNTTWMPPFLPNFFHPKEYYYFWRHYEDYIGIPIKDAINQAYEKYQINELESLIRTVRADMAEESSKIYGMQYKLPVLAIHAESVLFLSRKKIKNLSISALRADFYFLIYSMVS